MNTVDKAKQLVRIYYINATDFMDSNREAREASRTFALVCVEEILNLYKDNWNIDNSYWNEVKEELLKL